MKDKMNDTGNDKRLPIMEMFGPTIQGEGLMAGTVTNFIRTGGCGLKCKWCDTMFAVDPKQVRRGRRLMYIHEILSEIEKAPWAPYLTLTGGDPCLHKSLGDIIPAVNAWGTKVAVETQGTEFPDWLANADVITFSPKPPSSGNVVDVEPIVKWVLNTIGPAGKRPQRVCIKIVVFSAEDFNYAIQALEFIPSYLYDAFYFTGGTAIYKGSVAELSKEQLQEYSIEKATSVINNLKALAGTVIHHARSNHFNEKVHIGCQLHSLIWPHMDKGV